MHLHGTKLKQENTKCSYLVNGNCHFVSFKIGNTTIPQKICIAEKQKILWRRAEYLHR